MWKTASLPDDDNVQPIEYVMEIIYTEGEWGILRWGTQHYHTWIAVNHYHPDAKAEEYSSTGWFSTDRHQRQTCYRCKKSVPSTIRTMFNLMNM